MSATLRQSESACVRFSRAARADRLIATHPRTALQWLHEGDDGFERELDSRRVSSNCRHALLQVGDAVFEHPEAAVMLPLIDRPGRSKRRSWYPFARCPFSISALRRGRCLAIDRPNPGGRIADGRAPASHAPRPTRETGPRLAVRRRRLRRAMADVVRLPPDPTRACSPSSACRTAGPSTAPRPRRSGWTRMRTRRRFVAPGIDRRAAEAEARRVSPRQPLDVHGMTAAEAVAAVSASSTTVATRDSVQSPSCTAAGSLRGNVPC